MELKGTISAVANLLCSFNFPEFLGRLEEPGETGLYSRDPKSEAERLAQQRFSAKIEEPDKTKAANRREACWQSWIKSDQDLILPSILGPNWALAKQFLRKVLKNFSLAPVSFTNGSEFNPTLGWNSIESKLSRSGWTCTIENFDLWARTVYEHHGLKFAMRKRYASYLANHSLDMKLIDRKLWHRYKHLPAPAFEIFKFKLHVITEFVHGNRFSTVRKNNEVDRPICVEPLANILTQRRIGNGFRKSLLDYGVDLNELAKLHQIMISNPKVATIDLKNASDRIILLLVKYLFPRRIFDLIEQSRSAMTLGLDDEFYVTNKVSSMGNGFTFELMSLILLALCKSHTSECSVFGDDIIVPNEVASSVVDDLQHAGLIVNVNKTHINDTYRESCGAHFLDGYGYVESYDFRYPESIGDVITTWNKLVRLSTLYRSFIPLCVEVYRVMPAALLAENPTKAVGYWHRIQDTSVSYKLDTTAVRSPFQYRKDGLDWSRSAKKKWLIFCRNTQRNPNGASLHYGFEWVDKASAPTALTPKRNWAKILMYLAAGSKCKDTVKGRGTFKSFLAVTDCNGTTLRWSAILTAH